jgi:hypothetical protein
MRKYIKTFESLTDDSSRFELGTPVVYTVETGYPLRLQELSGEIVKENGIKGISLYLQADQHSFIVPDDWSKVKKFSE